MFVQHVRKDEHAEVQNAGLLLNVCEVDVVLHVKFTAQEMCVHGCAL